MHGATHRASTPHAEQSAVSGGGPRPDFRFAREAEGSLAQNDPLPHPELVEQDVPEGVVLVVADPPETSCTARTLNIGTTGARSAIDRYVLED
jgi:hypothetical protein